MEEVTNKTLYMYQLCSCFLDTGKWICQWTFSKSKDHWRRRRSLVLKYSEQIITILLILKVPSMGKLFKSRLLIIQKCSVAAAAAAAGQWVVYSTQWERWEEHYCIAVSLNIYIPLCEFESKSLRRVTMYLKPDGCYT